MIVKSFRGLLKDGAIEKIHLSTNDGRQGYRIVKFKLIPEQPVTSANECVMQIWKVEQTAASSEVDFSNQTLLGVGIYSNQTDTTYYPDDETIVFDNDMFNQDIYLTHNNASGSGSCNYYLELEQMELSLNEQTVATLQNIRDIGV